MNKKKLVSIIVPTYNSKKYIFSCLNSILNQTYKNFEIIIVDDCSTDGTYEYLKNFIKKISAKGFKIKIIKTKKNSGTVAHPRNYGLKECSGDLVCFLDSDDYWENTKLEKQISQIKNKKVIYCTSAKYFDLKGKKSNFFLNYLRKRLQFYIIKKVNNEGFFWFYIYNPIIVSSVLLDKKILKENQFDENKYAREDYDLWIRLRKHNYKFKLKDDLLVNICRRPDSMSSNIKKELITAVSSLSNVLFKINNFSKLNFFLFGIIIKFLITFIKINKIFIFKFLKRSSIFLFILFFLTFYSPLFWYLGKPLLHFDETKKINGIENIVVFSGHGDTSYYNMTYQYRYRDIKNLTSNIISLKKIYILGRLQEIPEQKILEKLLISDGFDEKKLEIIYKEYNSTFRNISEIAKILEREKIKEIIFVTSPYHTKRAKLLWKNFSEIDVKFFKGYEWPTKNNFFQYAKNKKIILYEYTSIFYNKLIGNI